MKAFNEDPQLRNTPFAMTTPASDIPNISHPIVLVGLMGAGKSSIGRRLAAHLGLNFIDADDEIIKSAGCSIADIFTQYGEEAFRDVEKKVILRLLDEGPMILATGGGAFINNDIRAAVKEKATSVWLRADLDVLVERTSRRDNRPLLKEGDPREILQKLIDVRYPVYEKADISVDSGPHPHEVMVEKIVTALIDTPLSQKETKA